MQRECCLEGPVTSFLRIAAVGSAGNSTAGAPRRTDGGASTVCGQRLRFSPGWASDSDVSRAGCADAASESRGFVSPNK